MATEAQTKPGMTAGAGVFIGVLILVLVLVGVEMVVTIVFFDKFIPVAGHH